MEGVAYTMRRMSVHSDPCWFDGENQGTIPYHSLLAKLDNVAMHATGHQGGLDN